jgi:hypothetical protein
MDSRRTFGRRIAAQPSAPHAAVQAPANPIEPILSSLPSDTTFVSVDDEIEAWKAARGPVVPFPWRQLSLMAGLCFGIASFVLPDTVNNAVQWPLYALTAISLYAGLRKRKNKTN